MKKLFTLIAAALVGVTAFADVLFHSPAGKEAGTPFEYTPLYSALSNAVTKGGVAKWGVDPNYQWIIYTNNSSILDNGKGEVQQSDVYVSTNPLWMNEEWVVAKHKSPVVTLGFTKSGDYFASLNPKTMSFNVTDASRVDFQLTGAGSNTNDVVVIVRKKDQTLVDSFYVEPMVGKSNWITSDYTNSKWVSVKNLDVNECYSITIVPCAKNAQLKADGEFKAIQDVLGANVDFTKDITLSADLKVSDYKVPSVAVVALHIYGKDLTVNGEKAIRDASTTFYAPEQKDYYEGANFTYFNLANASTQSAAQTTWDANGDPVFKKGVKAWTSEYPNIDYTYTASRVNGVQNTTTSLVAKSQMEANLKSMTYSFNPITLDSVKTVMGQKDDEAKTWVGTPCIENGYAKSAANYFSAIYPKTLTFNVKDATNVEFALTGAGSTSVKQPLSANKYNSVDIIVKADDGSESWIIMTDSLKMQGKSYKASDPTTWSQLVSVNGKAIDGETYALNSAKAYTITIAPAYETARFKIKVEGEEDTYPLVSSIVPASVADRFTKDIVLTDDQKVENILTGSVNVAAVRVYGKDKAEDLGSIITKKVKAGENSYKLIFPEYALADTAKVDTTTFTLEGNNKRINVGAKGRFTTKKSLTIKDAFIDATASTIAPIALAPTAELNMSDSTYLFTYKERFTKEEADRFNVIHAPAIAAGTVVAATEGKYYNDYPDDVLNDVFVNKPKYAGAKKYGMEAQLISLKNSTVLLSTSLVDGYSAKGTDPTGTVKPAVKNEGWNLRNLEIDSCVIFKSGSKQWIDMSGNDNGSANTNVQNVSITKSTLADELVKKCYLLHGAAKNAVEIWGTNDASGSIKITYSTLANIKYIANNNRWANNDKLNVTLVKNIYSDVEKVRQGIGNCKLNEHADTLSVICGTVNTSGDENYAKYDNTVGVFYVNKDDYNFIPEIHSLAAMLHAGDPRWYPEDYRFCDYHAIDKLAKLLTRCQDYVDIATPSQKSGDLFKEFTYHMELANTIIVQGNPLNDDDLWAAMDEYTALNKAFIDWLNSIGYTAIETVNAEATTTNGAAYNLAGQRVNANVKGLIIRNGKKFMNK